MTNNDSAIPSQSATELTASPLVMKWHAAHEVAEAFYQRVKAMEFNAADVDSRRNLIVAQKDISRLERVVVAYASAKNRPQLKRDAQQFAQRHFVPGMQHPAVGYAHAEVRIRKLEILCLASRQSTPDHLLQLSAQLEIACNDCIRRWNEVLMPQVSLSKD